MKKSHRRWKMSALAVLAAAAAPAVYAQTVSNWTGTAGDSLWGTGGNWDNGVPTTGFTADFNGLQSTTPAIISLSGTQSIGTILFDGSAGSPASFTLGGSGDTFFFDAGGAINVTTGVSSAQTIGATVQTNGSLNVSNGGTGGLTLSNVVINGGGTLSVTGAVNNNTTTLAGNISDAGGVGSLLLSANNTTNSFVIGGANTYSGTTTISVATGSAGSIQLGSDTAFSTGKVFINITGSSSPQITSTGTRTLANAIDLNSGITFSDANTYTLTGPINFINAGGTGRTLSLSSTNGAIVNFGASTSSASTITLGNPVANGGDGVGKTLVVSAAANALVVLNDNIQDPAAGGGAAGGSIQPQGAGTIRFNGQNTYSGLTNFPVGNNTIIQIGSSSVMSGTSIASGPFGVGTFQPANTTNAFLQAYNADQTVANPVNLVFGMTVIDAPTTGYNADPTGAHNLTFTGPVNFGTAGRTLNINTTGHSVTFGSTSAASTFTLPTGTSAQTVSIIVSGGAAINLNDVIQDAPGAPAGTISYTNNGTNGIGTIVLNAQNTYAGTTNFTSGTNGSQGIVQIAVSSVTSGSNIVSGPFGKGTITLNTNANTPMIFEPINSDQTIANPVTMSAGVFVNNVGTNIRSLTFTGPIALTTARTLTDNVNAGASVNFGTAGTSQTLTLSGQLTVQSQQTFGSAFIINDLVQNSGTNKGTLLSQNNVNVTLTNPNNTFGGGVTMNSGSVVNVSSDGNLGAATSGVTINAGTLLSTGTFSSPSRPMTLSGTGTDKVDVTGTNIVTWNGAIGGVDGLTKGTNTGTLILAGTANSYALGTTINGGTLGANADGSLGASGTAVNIGPGTFLGNASFTTSRTMNLTAVSSALDASGANTLILTGTVTDAGTVNKGPASGTVQFAQPSGYTPTSNVNVLGGDLVVGAAGVATGPLVVPGTLNVADTAKVALLPSSTGVGTNSGVVHNINNLNLNTTGVLDLGNTAMTVGATTPIATIRQYLINGYSNGNWNGTSGGGITSTWAANDATKRSAVGYAAQPDGTTLVAATIYGDTTLKGSVGLSDYNTLASNFNKPGVWAQGDFNYDNTVGLTDYNLLAANFNKSAQPGGGAAAAGAGGAAKAAAATLTGSASPAGQSVLPANVVDPGAGKVALEADPTTGKIYIVGHDSNINSYEVDSAAGKLTFVSQKNSGGYNTLTAQTAVNSLPGSNNPSEDSWAIISSGAGTFVAEAYPASDIPAFDIIGPGLQVFDLNKSGLSAWAAGTPISDLTFKYGNGTGATLTPAVIALGSGVPEPTCLALAGIAAGGLLSRKRRKTI